MKKVVCIIVLCLWTTSAFGADIIVTKQKQKYHGKVVRIIDRGFVVRTVEGSVIVIPKENISKIYRENKVLDFEERMSYYINVRRPFLPFIVLGAAAAAYSVKKYNDYSNERNRINSSTPEDLVNMEDKSKTHLAWCVVSGLFSVGSFYIAFKPMEMKVPIGRLNLSATSQGITLALHF